MIKDDPVCKQCINKRICRGTCPPLIWINGYIPRKEPLFSEINNPFLEHYNYNETIAELIEDRREQFDNLHEIKNVRRRAIAAMLSVKITKTAISKLLNMSLRQIIRITHKKQPFIK